MFVFVVLTLFVFANPKHIDNYFLFEPDNIVVISDYKIPTSHLQRITENIVFFDSKFYFSWCDGEIFRIARITKQGQLIDDVGINVKSYISSNGYPIGNLQLVANKYGIYGTIRNKIGSINTVIGAFFSNGNITKDFKFNEMISQRTGYRAMSSNDSLFFIAYTEDYSNNEQILVKIIDKYGSIKSVKNDIVDTAIQNHDLTIAYDSSEFCIFYTNSNYDVVMKKISPDGDVHSDTIIITHLTTQNNGNVSYGYKNVAFGDNKFYLTLTNEGTSDLLFYVLDINGKVLNDTSFTANKNSDDWYGINSPIVYKNRKVYFKYYHDLSDSGERVVKLIVYDCDKKKYNNLHQRTTNKSNCSFNAYVADDGVFTFGCNAINNTQFMMGTIVNDSVVMIADTVNYKNGDENIISLDKYNGNFTVSINHDENVDMILFKCINSSGNILADMKKHTDGLRQNSLKIMTNKTHICISENRYERFNFIVSKDLFDTITVGDSLYKNVLPFNDGFASITHSSMHAFDNSGILENSFKLDIKKSKGVGRTYTNCTKGENGYLLGCTQIEN